MCRRSGRVFISSKMPKEVEEVLTLSQALISANDPIEEKFRQFEAQIEILKAEKDPGTMDS